MIFISFERRPFFIYHEIFNAFTKVQDYKIADPPKYVNLSPTPLMKIRCMLYFYLVQIKFCVCKKKIILKMFYSNAVLQNVQEVLSIQLKGDAL